MDPLCYKELTTEEKIYLGNLSNHPGYVVFERLIQDAAKQATEELVKLDPVNDSDYDRKLKQAQLVARVTNQVCANLIKSIEMHTIAGKAEDQLNKIKEAAVKVGSEVPQLSPGLGSLKIKSPKSDELSNQE